MQWRKEKVCEREGQRRAQASEAGKADAEVRDDVEASGEDWWWQFNDDKTDMLPSYAVNNPLEGKGPNHRAV